MIVPFLLSAVAGTLYSFGFPSFLGKGIFLLPTLSLFILFQIWHKTDRLKYKIVQLLLFSILHTYTGYYWIAGTLKDFGEMPSWLAYLLQAFFSLIVVPKLWIFLLFFHFIYHHHRIAMFFARLGRASTIFLLALIFCLIEFYTPTQFPGHLGHNWLTIAPYLGLAPYAGALYYSFLSFILIFTALHFLKSKKVSFFPLTFVILSLITGIIFPLKNTPGAQSLQIKVIQPNVGNFLKLDSEKGNTNSISQIFDSIRNLSLQNSGIKTDLVILPETAYPFSLYSPKLNAINTNSPSLFSELSMNVKAAILTGGYDLKYENSNYSDYETEFNSSFLFDSKGKFKQVYHKSILIPFGETLPVGPLKPLIAKFIKNISYFAVGETKTKFKINNYQFITPICYEVLFPDYLRLIMNSSEDPVHFIVNLTNDSWYGITSELEQHLFLAHWRALEFQIPIVRATNTGITSVLLPDGSESPRLKIHQPDVLDYKLNLSNAHKTLYLRFGSEITILIAIIAILMTYLLRKPSFSKS
jgi:apolipoprotein N-acyltransferase